MKRAIALLLALAAAVGLWAWVSHMDVLDQLCGASSLRYTKTCWDYEIGKWLRGDE